MSRTTACPEESQLLALAAGSADVFPSLRSHVEACPACLRKVRRLRAEIVHLRANLTVELPPWRPTSAQAYRSAPGAN